MDNISDILRTSRQKLNLSVEDLSQQTKIRPNIIESIENNQLSDFQVVYLKAYIRNIAKELQIDKDPEYIESYKKFIDEFASQKNTQSNNISISDFDAYQTNSQNKKNDKIFRSAPALNRNLLIYSGIVIFVIVILFITFSPFQKSTNDETKETEIPKTEKTNLVIKNNTEETLIDYFKGSDSLLLQANVSDSVWINITIDSAKRISTILLPNKEYEWRASKNFVITHGNAGKISFALNGKDLPPFARPGYIAKNISITKEGVYIAKSDSTIRARSKKKEKNQTPQIRSIEPTEIEGVKPKLK